MFKVCAAEFKKILSRPGIYILSALLAVILILGAIIYKPTPVESSQVALTGTTFEEKYASFYGDKATYGEKLKADEIVSSAISRVHSYTVSTEYGEMSIEEHILGEDKTQLSLKTAFDTNLSNYRNDSSNGALADSIEKDRKLLVDSLNELYNEIQIGLTKGANDAFPIVTTQENNENLTALYKNILELFSVKDEKAKIANTCAEYDKEYKKDFEKALGKLSFPSLSKNFVLTYTTLTEGTNYTLLQERLSNVLKDIETAKAEGAKAVEMDRLATKYKDICTNYSNLIKYELITNAFDNLSTTEQMDAIYLVEYSNYNCNSLLLRYRYLFDNNKVDSDYARPLTIGTTSNAETNTYDYAYFVLKLFSFVIVVFATMTACHSIAGEAKEGSLRYLAIRPVSRIKLFFGKFLSIISLSFILSIFSGIIALVVGGAFYGFSSSTVLTIFNSSTAITLHPICLLLIFMLSTFIELIIYTAIAMMLSCLLKSDLLAVTIMIVLYLINTMLPVFVLGYNTWLCFYPFSHISLYSLFGSSVFAVKDSFISALLGAKVYSTTALSLYIGVIVTIIAATCFIANYKFKDKEI